MLEMRAGNLIEIIGKDCRALVHHAADRNP